jgi:hypothetical protein
LGLGARIFANQDQSSAAISDCEDDQITVPGRDRPHCDVQKLTSRLIKVLKPQFGSNFSWRKT